MDIRRSAGNTATSSFHPAATNVPPSQSLYVQNLPEKLQKSDLRRALYILFSTFGPVLDVTALKTKKMRGQAHILFRDVGSATQALRSCQGFDVFGREMRISYSKNRSNTLAKLTGTFNQPVAAAAEQPTLPAAFPPPPGAPQQTKAQGAAPAAAPPVTGLPPPPGLPPKVGDLNVPAKAGPQVEAAPSPQGTKRGREESDDEGEAPMEEDEDEMEMSEEDD